MSRFGQALLTLVAMLSAAAPGLADDWEDCAKVAAEETAIAACSRLIARGRLSRQHAGTLFSNRGAAHLNRGDYDLALRDLNEALHFNPQSPNALYNRGVVYYFKEDYERSVGELSRALKLRPSHAKTHYYRGRARLALRRNSQAIADFTATLRIEPGYEGAHLYRGRAFHLEGDLNSAVADYAQAMRLQPGNADVLGYRADVHLKLGRLDAALADADRALALAPDVVYALTTRGEILEALGRLAEALVEFDKALRLSPRYREALDGRARVQAGAASAPRTAAAGASGRAAAVGCDSIEACSERIRLDPRDANAYNDRGHVYFEKNEDDRAIADFTRAIEIDQALADAYFGRGFVRLGRNELREALADLTAGIRLEPGAPRAHVLRADAYLQLGQLREALADAERAIGLDPRSGIAHLLRAKALAGLGRRSEAIAGARRAAELEPNRAAARELLARIERGASTPDTSPGGTTASRAPPVASGERASGAARPDGSRSHDTPAILKLLGNYNRTGSALLLGFAGRYPSDNIVLSPFSIGSAMAMALHGASGETEQEMRRALAYELTRQEIATSNAIALGLLAAERPRAGPLPTWAKGLTSALARGPGFEVKIANALAMRRQQPPAAAYVTDLRTSFGAQTLEDASLDSINSWVRGQTNGRIDRILDRLDPQFMAVLLNAVTLSARWETPFDPTQTADRAFTLGTGTVKRVPTMRQVGTYFAAAGQGMRAVRIAFADPKVDMIVVVPDDPRMLARDNLVATFTTRIDAALELLSKAQPQRMELSLPRFKIAFRTDLVEIFKVMGMHKAFDPTRGEFDHLTGRPGSNVAIDQIQHSVVLDVGELGTEAVAATAVSLAPGAGRAAPGAPLPAFHVDRPFYFSIGDGRSGVKLFAGVVVDPSRVGPAR